MGAGQTLGQRGFTLLELIVVLLVLGLTASLATPTIGRSLEALRVRAEVAGFAAVLRHAREQAITSRRAQLVVTEPEEHQVLAGPVAAKNEDRRRHALPASWTIETTPPQHFTVRFEPQGTSSGFDARIVSSTFAYRVTVDGLTGRVKTTRE